MAPTSPESSAGGKFFFAAVGLAAVAGALFLLLLASFPYVYAESGSARYAAEHRGEAILELIGAIALAWLAWTCLRRAMAWKFWIGIVAVLIVFAGARSINASRTIPPGAYAIGGGFYAHMEVRPREADTLMYSIYFKRLGRYQMIESQVSEYRFVPPDCLSFYGLRVVGRPAYAMCGYRIPLESYDTTVAESELLARAKKQPGYRADWRYRR